MSQTQNDRKADRPWLIRTYAGHSTAEASNALYRSNLAKGQTGLSVASALPTQTGYDRPHVLARGEVGTPGVPVSHPADPPPPFHQTPTSQLNPPLTINPSAPCPWPPYIATAEEHATAPHRP